MVYDPQKHHRRSIRLKGYDYSRAGAYFITICVQNGECLFGEIVDGLVRLNDAGCMIQRIWNQLPQNYPGVDIDAFIAMPNHIHGIIALTVGAGPRACPPDMHDSDHRQGHPQGGAPTVMSLTDVVHRFKSLTTTRYRQGVTHHDWPPFPGKLWQRNYYEHIIRDDDDLDRIRQYIANNPARWTDDENHPANIKPSP